MCAKRNVRVKHKVRCSYLAAEPNSQHVPQMWKHLRAWRKFRGMSLEHVANILSVSHTTLMRWEKGTAKVTLGDLERLAKIYSATPSQLMGAPSDAALVALLDRVHEVVTKLPAEAVEDWLRIGERLVGRE